MTLRAFLAVDLDEDLRGRVAALQQTLKQSVQQAAPSARLSWTAPATMHLTIKFLGEIEDALVAPLRHRIAAGIGELEPIAWPLDRLGAFPHPRDPRTIWIGPTEAWRTTEAGKRLTKVHRSLEEACFSLGLAKDHRPFAPHLTIARVRSGDRLVGRALLAAGAFDRPLQLGPLAIGSITLMKSELGRGGAVHTALWRAP